MGRCKTGELQQERHLWAYVEGEMGAGQDSEPQQAEPISAYLRNFLLLISRTFECASTRGSGAKNACSRLSRPAALIWFASSRAVVTTKFRIAEHDVTAFNGRGTVRSRPISPRFCKRSITSLLQLFLRAPAYNEKRGLTPVSPHNNSSSIQKRRRSTQTLSFHISTC